MRNGRSLPHASHCGTRVPCVRSARTFDAPHSPTCIVLQAAGKKYTVPEQGKMLGAEWKGLSDKDKEKYA